MRIVTDLRSGVHNQDSVIDAEDVDEAIFLLKRLDGKRYTMIDLVRSDGRRLTIGGGPSHFVVTLNDQLNSLTLLNLNGVESTIIELCAGGQFGEFSETICVDQRQAKKAIEMFFSGTENSATWG
jgi:hypothetical protein